MSNKLDETLSENVPGGNALGEEAAGRLVQLPPADEGGVPQPTVSEAAGQPATSASDVTAESKPAAWERFCEWFYMERELGQAREIEARSSAFRKAALERASAHAQVADWALESGAGSPYVAALSLYREACFWLLVQDGAWDRTHIAVWDAAPQSMLEKAAGGKAKLMRLRNVLAEGNFLTNADMPLEEQLITAGSARSFVRALLEQAVSRTLRGTLARRRRRMTRVSLLLLGAFIVMLLLGSSITSPTDLARGKPWKVSSEADIILPAHMMFHTNSEMNPWFEIDLGSPMPVRRLYVRNRSDCCLERAIPLVAEVSVDHANWTEVAKQESIFTEWTPRFPSVEARYVRLRIPQVGILHLERVKVY